MVQAINAHTPYHATLNPSGPDRSSRMNGGRTAGAFSRCIVLKTVDSAYGVDLPHPEYRLPGPVTECRALSYDLVTAAAQLNRPPAPKPDPAAG